VYPPRVRHIHVKFTSFLNREENKLFSFRRRENQKITLSDNPPIKVTLLWSHHESKKKSLKRDIMLGQVGHRKQGKPRMRWLGSIMEATGLRLEDLREAVQDKNGVSWWKKRLGIEYGQM
jgi:hypothetical protein